PLFMGPPPPLRPIPARRPTGRRHGARPGTAIAGTSTARISTRARATSRRLTAAGISAARLTGELAVLSLGPALLPARADCLTPSCALSGRTDSGAALNLP